MLSIFISSGPSQLLDYLTLHSLFTHSDLDSFILCWQIEGLPCGQRSLN